MACVAVSYTPPLYDVTDDPAGQVEDLVADCTAGRFRTWDSIETALNHINCQSHDNTMFRCVVASLGSGFAFVAPPHDNCVAQLVRAVAFSGRCQPLSCGVSEACPFHNVLGFCNDCRTEALIGRAMRGCKLEFSRRLPPSSVRVGISGPELARLFRAACEGGHTDLARDVFAWASRRALTHTSNHVEPPTLSGVPVFINLLLPHLVHSTDELSPRLIMVAAAARAGMSDIVFRLLRREKRYPMCATNLALFFACLSGHLGLAFRLVSQRDAMVEAGFLGACAGANLEALAAFGEIVGDSVGPHFTLDVGFRFAVLWANDSRFAEKILTGQLLSHRRLGWSFGCVVDAVKFDLCDLGRHRVVCDVVELGLRLSRTRSPPDLDHLYRAVARCRGDSVWLHEAQVLLLLEGASSSDPGKFRLPLCTDMQRRLIARGVWPPGGTCRSLRGFCIETRRVALEAVDAATGLATDIIRHCILTYLW